MFVFSLLSKLRRKGLHPDLDRVVVRALEISTLDFIVVEGVRTLERQRELFRQGKSKTLNSRHLTGHAVDLCPYVDKKLVWELCPALAETVKIAAKMERVPIEWGGDWKSFKDGPHYQLPWSEYL